MAVILKLYEHEICYSQRREDRLYCSEKSALGYIASPDFRDDCEDENIDHVIIQIDTDKCEDWKEGIINIGNNTEEIPGFVEQIRDVLIRRIGTEYYPTVKHKIIFAVCVHEIECWLLPFHAAQSGKTSKIVGCAKAIEQIAIKQGFSINQKNYEDGKHYDDLSKEMKNHKTLMQKSKLNAGLNNFLESLSSAFPTAVEE